MLPVHTVGRECWDEEKNEFYYPEGGDYELEHSLYAVSLWESKYHKSFINSEKTAEETLDYIKMMVIKGDPEKFVKEITQEQMKEIGKYINDPMTATVISEEEEKEINKQGNNHKFTTSEEIYSWMALQQIPFECEKWHLNRLIVLIKLCAIANKPKDKKKKKMTSSDLALRRARMEAARAKYASKN